MMEDRGWTRGHATCAFDAMPPAAPGFLRYGALRLAGLQTIDAGAGYETHSHVEVETITCLLSGTLTHQDNLRGTDLTGPDDVAVLSAGTGMRHSEKVHGPTDVRAVIFWLRSEPAGEPPRFLRKTFDRGARRNTLAALASGRSARDVDGPLPIRCDAEIFSAVLDAGANVTHALGRGRCGYLLPTDGALEVNGVHVETGGRLLAAGPGSLAIRALAPTEVFLVDLAAGVDEAAVEPLQQAPPA
jgi:redox-sensitive bicupin YhaK (pirin superfamily)